jgi:hypothetical protein
MHANKEPRVTLILLVFFFCRFIHQYQLKAHLNLSLNFPFQRKLQPRKNTRLQFSYISESSYFLIKRDIERYLYLMVLNPVTAVASQVGAPAAVESALVTSSVPSAPPLMGALNASQRMARVVASPVPLAVPILTPPI